MLTPPPAPAVLDEPELLSVFGTITNSKHSMVKASSASGTVEDTRRVRLEDRAISFDRDSQRLLGESSFHGRNVILINVIVVRSTSNTLIFIN